MQSPYETKFVNFVKFDWDHRNGSEDFIKKFALAGFLHFYLQGVLEREIVDYLNL